MHSRNIKTPQIKKLEKTQKQLNELRKDFNKFQSETKKTIQEIYEIKKTTQDMKEEFNKDMENLRKNNQAETLEIKSSLNQIKI
jgi:conjugal transfer/entry exclusion protein